MTSRWIHIDRNDRQNFPNWQIRTLIFLNFTKTGGIATSCYISKRHFRPGGMAPSEWTRSVKAVRDTPVADYSAPGVNTRHRVAYRPLIAVLPILLALLVYTKCTLYLSHLLISLTLSTISWIYAIAWTLAARQYQIFSPSSYAPRARLTLDHGLVRQKGMT